MRRGHQSGKAGLLDTHERAVLDRAIYRTYTEVGIIPDVSTHVPSAPLLEDLYTVLGEAPSWL